MNLRPFARTLLAGLASALIASAAGAAVNATTPADIVMHPSETASAQSDLSFDQEVLLAALQLDLSSNGASAFELVPSLSYVRLSGSMGTAELSFADLKLMYPDAVNLEHPESFVSLAVLLDLPLYVSSGQFVATFQAKSGAAGSYQVTVSNIELLTFDAQTFADSTETLSPMQFAVSVVPEPASASLLVGGALLLLVAARRRAAR